MSASELAGPAFDPTGTRLYFSSQRGRDGRYAALVPAPDDEKRSIAIARSFGMYGYDMRLCARWCVAAIREREPVEAARLGIRALRYAGKYGIARTRAKLPR